MKPALLVLAAGLGSRYGGFKQIEPIGPNGEFIIDYSIFDALRAGFGPIVMVTQPQLEEPIREHLHDQLGDDLDLSFAFQSLDDVPSGFSRPVSRTKPWGTAHAVRAARAHLGKRFGVINADDFYGPRSYVALADHLTTLPESDTCIVGFELVRTLSRHGSVSRGICRSDADGLLVEVIEHTKVTADSAGNALSIRADGQTETLPADSMSSMNMWGFGRSVFAHLETQFADFLTEHGQDEKSEFFIPSAVDTLIKTRQSNCRVLRTAEQWFGVTYKEDREAASASIGALIQNQTYPSSLRPR